MHKVLCSAIHQLALKEREYLLNTMFASHVSPKEQKRLISLVGQKCTVNCLMNDKPVTALWDTGAMASLMNTQFLVNNLGDLKISKISDLLDTDIELTAAKYTHIPFLGWVEIRLKLFGKSQNSTELTVPILLTKEKLELPIIGYNSIEHFIHEFENSQAEPAVTISDILCDSLYEKNELNVSTYVNFVKTRNENNPVCSVRTNKNSINVPKGKIMKIPCNVNALGIYEKNTCHF